MQQNHREIVESSTATRCRLSGARYGASRPILLVHGFASNAAMLAPLARHLSRTLRRMVVRVQLSAGRDDLRNSAAALQRVLEEHGAHPDFEHADIVAHSMGGLTATYLLKKLDRGRRVRSVVTLGTPHRGAPLAGLGVLVLGALSRALWQMIPGSGLVSELRTLEAPNGSRVVSIAGTSDWLVPSRWSRLDPRPSHRNLTLPGLSHCALLVAREALDRVAQELVGSPAPALRPAAVRAAALGLAA
jgi:pimeloyl-ACP methyl ester carboxylesterase